MSLNEIGLGQQHHSMYNTVSIRGGKNRFFDAARFSLERFSLDAVNNLNYFLSVRLLQSATILLSACGEPTLSNIKY